MAETSLQPQDALKRLASLARQAETQPVEAAREYWALAGSHPELTQALAAFSRVPDMDLAQFEGSGPDLLVLSASGRFWLCPAHPKDFDGQEPVVTLRGMRALGLAYADLVKEDEFMASSFGL